MDKTKNFPNLEDMFNELWTYSDQKDIKEAYKDIYPASNLSKYGNTTFTKFLISLGDRLQKHKNSSIESDEIKEVSDRKESLTSSERSSPDDREGHERKHDSSSSPRTSKEERGQGLITLRKFSDQRPSPIKGNLLISIDKDADPNAKKGGSVERNATPRAKTGSAKKRNSSLKKKPSKRPSFVQSLLSEMPRLDEFKQVESFDFPVNTLRFGDESIHTVYEWVKEPVEEGKVQDLSISKTHNFKTSFAKIEHEKFNNKYYGVDESDFEDEVLSERDLSPIKSDKSSSDTSDEDESGPIRYHYQRFKIPPFGKELYKFERKFNQYLERKLKKTYQDIFGFKEPIYCDFANPTLIQDKRRRYIKKKFDESRNKVFRQIREEHDKFYKYVEDTSGCKKVQHMDDIRRAEYLLEKFLKAEKDFKPTSETFDDTSLTKRKLKKLKKLEMLFKFETDKPIDAIIDKHTMNSLSLKLKKSAALAKRLRETIYDVLIECIFDDNFYRLLEIESEKHDPGMRLKPMERFSLTSLITECEDNTEEKIHIPTPSSKNMIIGRDFSKVPLKDIKCLEKLGFLYEETLYDKPDHPLYKINLHKDRKSSVITLGKTQLRRSSSKPISPLANKKRIIKKQMTKKPMIRKPKPPTGGIKDHKDSLGRQFRSKNKKSLGGSKESEIFLEEIIDEDEGQSPMKKRSATPDKANSPKAISQPPALAVQTSEIRLTSPLEEIPTDKNRRNSNKTGITKDESSITRKINGKRLQKGSSLYAIRNGASETKKKNVEENEINGQIKLSTSPVEDSNVLKGRIESPVKSRRRSILNPSDSPRPSQRGKSRTANSERLKSINERKKSSSPVFRIEFDPISSGIITKAMQEFSLLYKVPINELSKLTEGILNIEPEDRKDSVKKKIGRRKTDEGPAKEKALRIKSEEKVGNSTKSEINKTV